jgi:hypothetical protein
MNDKERAAFSLAFSFYEKWREKPIETDEQWSAFAEDVGRYVREADCSNCRLAWHLLEGVLNTFNDLYKDGKVPLPANYFGREDL